MQIQVYNLKGEEAGQIEINDYVFGVPFNEAVVHQALVRQMANRRVGTADTQTRGEVSKTGRKPFAQKHTGRARRGSAKSPLLKGGGVVFGPHPRSYHQDMPKKMRRLALRCVLSAKVREGKLKVVEKLEFEQPKTKLMLDALVSLGINTPVIIATAGVEPGVIKSAHNLPRTRTIPAHLLNVADMLSYKSLIMTVDAVRKVEQLWGQKSAREVSSSAN